MVWMKNHIAKLWVLLCVSYAYNRITFKNLFFLCKFSFTNQFLETIHSSKSKDHIKQIIIGIYITRHCKVYTVKVHLAIEQSLNSNKLNKNTQPHATSRIKLAKNREFIIQAKKKNIKRRSHDMYLICLVVSVHLNQFFNSSKNRT